MHNKEDKFGRMFYVLVLVNAMLGIAFYIITPVLTKYLTQIGVSLVIASIISGLFSLTSLCTRPFTGILVDTLKPRKILYISIPMLILSMLGYALTTNQYLIVVLRIINGVAFCFNGTTISAYASMYIPPKRMGEGIGYLGLGSVIATALGPVIGLSIGTSLGYRNAFLVAAVFGLASLLLLLIFNDQPKVITSNTENITKKKSIHLNQIIAVQLLPLAFLNGIFSYANGTVSNFLVLLSEERNIENCSIYFTVLACCMFIFRPISGKLNDKYGLPFLLIPAYIMAGVGMFLVSGMKTLPMLIISAICMAFGQGGGQPSIQSQCIKELSIDKRGIAISTYYIFADVFQGLGPITGGLIADHFGYAAPFTFAGWFLIIGLVLFVLLQYHKKNLQKRSGKDAKKLFENVVY